MKLRVSVTCDDISHGQAIDCARCPVARALNRLLVIPVFICQSGFSLIDKTLWYGGITLYYGETPEAAHDFIAAFDGAASGNKNAETWRLKPFQFEVEIPQKFVKRTVVIDQRIADFGNQMSDRELAELRSEYGRIVGYQVKRLEYA